MSRRPFIELLQTIGFKTGLGASLMALGNSALGWEKTHNMDFWLDVDMFNGLISDGLPHTIIKRQ